ncbi:MAG: hypothetical protein IJT88_03635 [Kiritimatiellae bacterium]|nr:hypothetical protein [Kiritimatiellia bacterium]
MARNTAFLRLMALAASMAAVLPCGCSREGAAVPDRSAEQAASVSAKDWTAAQIKADPAGAAMAAIREKETEAARLREQETKLEVARQKAERDLAALAKAEAEARDFGRMGLPACRDAGTVYPVSVAGRSFPSREALYAELKEADRTCNLCASNRAILANQSARDAALLAKIRDRLSANASERYALERKADAARTAMEERDFDALVAIANDLSDSLEAALPSDELFAPPVRNLGEAGIDEKLGELHF